MAKRKQKEKIEAKVIGKVEWFDDRFYKIQKLGAEVVYYPSVTTILGVAPKPYLNRWRGEIGNREADQRIREAQERGNKVHHACAVLLKGGVVGYKILKDDLDLVLDHRPIEKVLLNDQTEMAMAHRFVNLAAELNFETILTDQTIFSDKYKFAGSLDFLAKIPKTNYNKIDFKAGLYICDIKTGSSSKEHLMQVAAYSVAYSELYQTKITGAIVIYLNAKNKTGIKLEVLKSDAIK